MYFTNKKKLEKHKIEMEQYSAKKEYWSCCVDRKNKINTVLARLGLLIITSFLISIFL